MKHAYMSGDRRSVDDSDSTTARLSYSNNIWEFPTLSRLGKSESDHVVIVLDLQHNILI